MGRLVGEQLAHQRGEGVLREPQVAPLRTAHGAREGLHVVGGEQKEAVELLVGHGGLESTR